MDENENFNQDEEYPLMGPPSDYIINNMKNSEDDNIADDNEEEEDYTESMRELNFFKQIEIFIENKDEILDSENEDEKFFFLRDIRKNIIVKISRCAQYTNDDQKIMHLIKPTFKIINQNAMIDEFVNILINTHDQKSVLLNIEILRTLNRISQMYQKFLNPQNVNEFIKLIDKRTKSNENRVVKHYAIILIGKVIRQSKEWAQMLLPLFEYVYDGLTSKFNSFDYYQTLRFEFLDILKKFIKMDDIQSLPNLTQISYKKGDPYIYALRGYTKMLSDTGVFPPKVVDYIIRMVLSYFYELMQKSDQYNIECISAAEKINILNDIISANYQGTFEVLKNSDELVKSFFEETVPIAYKSRYIAIYTASFRLISSFYRCGKQYQIYFDGFNYQIILNALFDEKIEIKTPIAACECIYNIVYSCHQEGFDLFFEGENIELFNQLIELSTSSNNPYKKKLALYKLIEILFEYYTGNTIDFDVNLFMKSTLSNIDEEDYELSFVAINALGSMYHRMKLLGFLDDFVDSFTELEGRESMVRIIDDEEGDLNQIAILFMNTLMEDGVPCAQP